MRKVLGLQLDHVWNKQGEIDKVHEVLNELTGRFTVGTPNKWWPWRLWTPFQGVDGAEWDEVNKTVKVFGQKPSARTHELGTLQVLDSWGVRQVYFRDGGQSRRDYVKAFRWIRDNVEIINNDLLISHAYLIGCPHEMVDCVADDHDDPSWLALADWAEENLTTGLAYLFRLHGRPSSIIAAADIPLP